MRWRLKARAVWGRPFSPTALPFTKGLGVGSGRPPADQRSCFWSSGCRSSQRCCMGLGGLRESPDRQSRFQRDWVLLGSGVVRLARGRQEDVCVVIPGSSDQDAGMIRAESSQPGWWQPNLGRWQPQPGMTATQPAQQPCKLC